jgi:hypothetical protein
MTLTKKVEVSKEAKQRAAMLLDVLAGSRTPPQAAEMLGISLMRYYQWEDRAMNGFLLGCEARPRGRQSNAETQLHALTKENERLKRELARYQSLVRLTQRSVGVLPPAATKESGKKRKRRPAVRALRRAEKLREEASQDTGIPTANGVVDQE